MTRRFPPFIHIYFVQIKIDAMAEEARAAEEAALAALREGEANATEEALSRVLADLEQDRAEAEANLKQQLQVQYNMIEGYLGYSRGRY